MEKELLLSLMLAFQSRPLPSVASALFDAPSDSSTHTHTHPAPLTPLATVCPKVFNVGQETETSHTEMKCTKHATGEGMDTSIALGDTVNQPFLTAERFTCSFNCHLATTSRPLLLQVSLALCSSGLGLVQ